MSTVRAPNAFMTVVRPNCVVVGVRRSYTCVCPCRWKRGWNHRRNVRTAAKPRCARSVPSWIPRGGACVTSTSRNRPCR